MELQSITNIRTKRDEIRESLKPLIKSADKETHYGNEAEYTHSSLLRGIDNLLFDISILTQAPNQFLMMSTLQERTTLYNTLNQISGNLSNPAVLFGLVDTLKIQLRPYQIRTRKKRFIEFTKEIEGLTRKKQDLEGSINETQELLMKSTASKDEIEKILSEAKATLEEFESEVESINKRKESLEKKTEVLNEIVEETEEIKNTASENLEQITGALNEAKSNEKLINSFAQKVQERDKKIDELKNETEEFQNKIKGFEDERKSYLKQAKELIDNAKTALNYSTAEGISAAFQSYFDRTSNSKILTWWLMGAISCLSAAIGIGIWIMVSQNNNMAIILGRIALLPFPIAGAIFCANQYVKQKNILEDYAYKMVLAKSIVGFSEQIKKHGSENNQEYVSYIQKVLDEIHRDPLRKREQREYKFSRKSQSENSLNELIEAAEKIVNMARGKD